MQRNQAEFSRLVAKPHWEPQRPLSPHWGPQGPLGTRRGHKNPMRELLKLKHGTQSPLRDRKGPRGHSKSPRNEKRKSR